VTSGQLSPNPHARRGCAQKRLQARKARGTLRRVAHYLFNFVKRDAAKEPAPQEQAVRLLRVGMWGIDVDEPHRNGLGVGDLALVYVGPPERRFIGQAEIASSAHAWTPSEAQRYPGDIGGGVLLTQVVEWEPTVPMSAVLSKIESPKARADFEAGVVRITASEYEAALAVAAERAGSTG